jgi:transcriptional regulator with XRE-family HTH domain
MIEQAIKERFIEAFDKIAFEQKLSAVKLCEYFPGLSPSRLSQLRSSKPKSSVSIEHLAIMVTEFDISANWLLTGKDGEAGKDQSGEILRRIENVDHNIKEVVTKLLEALTDGKLVDKMTLRKWIKAKN